MNFGGPQWLWGLLILPALLLLFLRAESRSKARLQQFVSPRLLAQLGATVSRPRRFVRFALLLSSVALALVSLAKPRWGYTYEDIKRKGLDLMVAIDTSRSMLANDVTPNRLQRVKLAAQDLINELGGDRVGLIAFAGRAFLQAPLTIDYDAAMEALNEIDTNIIPEGGTNISEAITLAVDTFGKSASGNRALIIFTDGEELAGDAAKLAKNAGDAGIRIFTVGVGTPEGSLIPLSQAGGGTGFVKDRNGQVVKSKLDEKRLREIAEATGAIFLPLGDGPATMQQLYRDGIAKLQAGEIDTRTSRHPIERYQWPLAGALLALAASVLINERKSTRRASSLTSVAPRRKQIGAPRSNGQRGPLPNAGSAVALLVVFCAASVAQAAAPGLDEYRSDRYSEAYDRFQETLKEHPETKAVDKIQFDAGAAAYKMKDYGKALQSFSQALLSPDLQMQSRSHYNLGNTLYQRGDGEKSTETKLKDWTNALQHYEQTLKIEPENKEAKDNYEFVKNKIDELKKQQQQQPSPTPSPSPSPSPQPKKDQKKQDQEKSQDQDKKQQQDQSESEDQKQDSEKGDGKNEQQKAGSSPSPSPSPSPNEQQAGATPSPSPGENSQQGSSPTPSPGQQSQPSPTPGKGESSPSPSPGQGNEQPSPSPSESDGDEGDSEGSSPTPAPSPSATAPKKPGGEVKGANENPPEQKPEEVAEAEEQPPDDKMSEQQAERLLRSMRDEEQRVQLDERKTVRRVYNDW